MVQNIIIPYGYTIAIPISIFILFCVIVFRLASLYSPTINNIVRYINKEDIKRRRGCYDEDDIGNYWGYTILTLVFILGWPVSIPSLLFVSIIYFSAKGLAFIVERIVSKYNIQIKRSSP
jgi:hypothetical protein